jgi:hypothetical protein
MDDASMKLSGKVAIGIGFYSVGNCADSDADSER